MAKRVLMRWLRLVRGSDLRRRTTQAFFGWPEQSLLVMAKAVITDHELPNLDIEREIAAEYDAEIVEAQAETPEEVIDAADGADGLIVTYAPITDEVFEALDDLKVVARFGIGVDNVDVESATEHGVTVVNVPDYCRDEVPEHTLALIMACERRVRMYDAAIRNGTWDWKEGKPIHRLRGQTLGLVGFGMIPRSLIEKTRALGFEYIGYDPYVSEEEFAENGVEKVSFETLLDRSDIVSVHAPLTEETQDLFDADAFARMSEQATLVNTARGGLVDTDALAEALQNGEIAAAGLDVLPEEPPEDSPLVECENAVLTPHAAFYSEESIEVLRRSAAEGVFDVLSGSEIDNVVNPSVLEE